jgi:hypothetical protein
MRIPNPVRIKWEMEMVVNPGVFPGFSGPPVAALLGTCPLICVLLSFYLTKPMSVRLTWPCYSNYLKKMRWLKRAMGASEEHIQVSKGCSTGQREVVRTPYQVMCSG